MPRTDPFPTIRKLAAEIGATWHGYEMAARGTERAEKDLRLALFNNARRDRLLRDRLLNADVSLVLCGLVCKTRNAKGQRL